MRRLILGLVAILAVTAAVLAATGAFRASAAVCQAKASGGHRPWVGDAPQNALSVSYKRHNGLLRSLSVTANPETADACTEVEIYGGAPGQPNEVVYRERVPMPSGSWSGTIRTSDWSGGCRADWRYFIAALSVEPGRSLADAVSEPLSRGGKDGTFELDGLRLLGCRVRASASTH
jgi:hypothetical protein